jgi:chromosome segregation protein
LTSQQEDLIEAKKSLEGIIRNLERKMKSDFKEKLEEIGVHFNEIFKKLFNGGEAKIVLDEDNDLLESDINIVAQPPGKKLQSIDLLSGGEKALTAISLLFGILKTKPSPFCVLDEIESALDDANVDRFARFLKEFNESSQFIVITHRKGTMEVADLLYGVTMEEQGITKIISLRLEDIEENNHLKEIENV